MKRCKICGGKMVKTWHWETGKNYCFYQCVECYAKSKETKIQYAARDLADGTKEGEIIK